MCFINLFDLLSLLVIHLGSHTYLWWSVQICSDSEKQIWHVAIASVKTQNASFALRGRLRSSSTHTYSCGQPQFWILSLWFCQFLIVLINGITHRLLFSVSLLLHSKCSWDLSMLTCLIIHLFNCSVSIPPYEYITNVNPFSSWWTFEFFSSLRLFFF